MRGGDFVTKFKV